MAPIQSPDASRFENHTAAGGGLFVIACLVGLLVASYPVAVTLMVTLVAMLIGGRELFRRASSRKPRKREERRSRACRRGNRRIRVSGGRWVRERH